MNPYPFVKDATINGESLLALCCGIGYELQDLSTQDVTAVDIARNYIDQVPSRCPQAKTHVSGALEFVKAQPDNSYDVVSLIDGLEHMDKSVGLELIAEMKRLARIKILLFIPEGEAEDGYLKNEPHNAWGIPNCDEHQLHKSGWKSSEIEDLGFDLVKAQTSISQHGERYRALMFIYNV